MNSLYDYEQDHKMKLARAYIKFQIMNQVFSPGEALKKGTLFPELYRPYIKQGDEKLGGEYYE
ncbi:spore coat associated protein CotJA [Wansuia hejianensis]|uniref:Spore coat associated protein CotJA n=1 Tax=Wansuia hejianensis TaxID=2763667 RepID=A0A926F3Z3_9FIRM|nr:spore coat associated protein CotJA [Wansuia hejianensis]MBC8591532.1 spore coat associated protein CotJA [Wansuia hejianensis]